MATYLATQSCYTQRDQSNQIRRAALPHRVSVRRQLVRRSVPGAPFCEDQRQTRRERNRRGIVLPQFPYVDWRPCVSPAIGVWRVHLAFESAHVICCYLLHRQRVRLMLTTEHGIPGKSQAQAQALFHASPDSLKSPTAVLCSFEPCQQDFAVADFDSLISPCLAPRDTCSSPALATIGTSRHTSAALTLLAFLANASPPRLRGPR